MLGKILTPRVENRRDANGTAEVAGISTECQQRVGHRAEEQRVDHARIALSEDIQRMRKREDDVN